MECGEIRKGPQRQMPAAHDLQQSKEQQHSQWQQPQEPNLFRTAGRKKVGCVCSDFRAGLL